MTPTTMSLGFSTAREYIATAPAKQEPPMESDRGAKRKPSVGISSGRHPSTAHKSISSFFGHQPAPQTSHQDVQARPVSVLSQSRSPATGFPTSSVSSSNVRAKEEIPAQFIRHRPPSQHFQPPRPVLEPSDPNRYTWLTASKPAEKPALHNAQLNRGMNPDENNGGMVTIDNQGCAGTAGGMRPATTFHTTTMSMVQSGGTTMRRTLGIRRSMNGWEERMKRAK
jgi:DNA helicase-2/ATP-dependent DNA helicase PcrA